MKESEAKESEAHKGRGRTQEEDSEMCALVN